MGYASWAVRLLVRKPGNANTPRPHTRHALSAVSLLVAGCAASGTGPGAGSSGTAPAPAAPADSGREVEVLQSEVKVVQELEISAFAEDSTVCRREAPLGSRIAVERCYSTAAPERGSSAALDEITRQEIETMRRRQMLMEQERMSREMALRQRAMMPRQ